MIPYHTARYPLDLAILDMLSTRLDRQELHDEQSELIWVMEKRTRKSGTSEPFTNPDGSKKAQQYCRRINEKRSFSYRDLFLLACGLFVLGPCLTFLWNHQGGKTPNGFDEVVGNPNKYIENDSEVISSSYEHLTMPVSLTPEETEENTAEADKESQRLAIWKAHFPYKPTIDLDVVITEEMIKVTRPSSPAGIQWMPERVL